MSPISPGLRLILNPPRYRGFPQGALGLPLGVHALLSECRAFVACACEFTVSIVRCHPVIPCVLFSASFSTFWSNAHFCAATFPLFLDEDMLLSPVMPSSLSSSRWYPLSSVELLASLTSSSLSFAFLANSSFLACSACSSSALSFLISESLCLSLSSDDDASAYPDAPLSMIAIEVRDPHAPAADPLHYY